MKQYKFNYELKNDFIKISEEGVEITGTILIEKGGFVSVHEEVDEEESFTVLSVENVAFHYEDLVGDCIEVKDVFIKIGGYIKRKDLDLGDKIIKAIEKNGVYDIFNKKDIDKEFMKKAESSFKMFDDINKKRMAKLITNSADPERWVIEFYYNAFV